MNAVGLFSNATPPQAGPTNAPSPLGVTNGVKRGPAYNDPNKGFDMNAVLAYYRKMYPQSTPQDIQKFASQRVVGSGRSDGPPTAETTRNRTGFGSAPWGNSTANWGGH